MDPKPLPLPTPRPEILDFLKTRRSNLSKAMGGPGPNDKEIEEILSIGARVPDHRKLAPWRFLIFRGDAREKAGQHVGTLYRQENPDLPEERIQFEADRFKRAPLVIGVISRPVDCPRGTPEWEQRLSSAVVCFNLCLAAQAMGFGAQWLTEWYSYDEVFCSNIGVSAPEKVAGFIYIGKALEPSMERPRPMIKDITSYY